MLHDADFEGADHSDDDQSEKEARLVARLRMGDEAAFSEMFRAHYRHVERSIRYRVGTQADVEDLTQETFVQALRSIGEFRHRSSIRTWLIGIARNVCFHHYRKTSRWMNGSHPMASSVEAVSSPVSDSPIENRVDARILLDRADQILRRTDRKTRHEIFWLRYGQCKPTREIAALMGKTNGAVKRDLRLTRARLRNSLSGLREAGYSG